MSQRASFDRRFVLGGLWFSASVVGVAILFLSAKVFAPVAKGYTSASDATRKLVLPSYDFQVWQSFPVQYGGRVMPLQTAAITAMRQITGRARFEGQDPVAILMSWILTRGESQSPLVTDWEHYPFILCDHHVLREAILRDARQGSPPSEEEIHGKYLSPAQIRNSPSLMQWLREGRAKRMKDPQKAEQLMTPEERKAAEVEQRLMTFDSLTQGDPVTTLPKTKFKPEDPLQVVALDRVAGAPWFSLGQLRQLQAEPTQWTMIMRDRLRAQPLRYLKPEHRDALLAFQAHIKAGSEKQPLEELRNLLMHRVEQKLGALRQATAERKSGEEMLDYIQRYLLTTTQEQQHFSDKLRELARRLQAEGQGAFPKNKNPAEVLIEQVRSVLLSASEELLKNLQRQAEDARRQGYVPEKDEFKMLHMTYLEQRFPGIYLESATAQTFPSDAASQVLSAFDGLRNKYMSGDPIAFANASAEFQKLIRELSRRFDATYPDCDTIDLEMLFNRVEPFKWAWITMAGASLCLAVSLGIKSNVTYWTGLSLFMLSLFIQAFGYYARVRISGRPPVTDMYETVVFVASMTAVFALFLEWLYRRKYIALAGSLVATLGLVLADQLPVTRGWDPSIRPLEPVLRSNYWLIVHVMTIVASYAGGALAWGMGNLILAMHLRRTPPSEQTKSLALFTYRAMQIALLLLAAGTFLGGWWAAESWGRFWGWDPKETWALIALIAYAIPLHARYLGWVKDFGLAVSAVVCFAAIVMSWYGVNFILGAGLHSYGFGGGGPWWVFWASLLNLEFVLIVSILYQRRQCLDPEAVPIAFSQEPGA
jgi:ABC-type transport system involved in cytochrome c biogenesis permease subunit